MNYKESNAYTFFVPTLKTNEYIWENGPGKIQYLYTRKKHGRNMVYNN